LKLCGDCIPVNIADLAKYPFLPQARQLISPLEFDYETIASIPFTRERAKQRIYASFDFKAHFSQPLTHDPQTEIASFALALAYASGIGDDKMIERFALYEADQINEYLKAETHEEVILEIARAFNWAVRVEEENKKRIIFIHFTKFLENSTKGRLHHNKKWKLVNRALAKGWVQISPYDLARLLQEEVKQQIENSAKQELGKVPEEIQQDIEELKTEFLKRKPQFEEIIQVVRAQESDYPPCISELMKRTSKGQHLSHVERFTLVTYLLHQGISVDTIVSLFSKVPDFKEDKTRYQVEHLAGERWGKDKPYITYNCATLQTHGVCSRPADPICKTIRNPLTYHLRKKGWKKIREP
jgi:DNA primase large subunit